MGRKRVFSRRKLHAGEPRAFDLGKGLAVDGDIHTHRAAGEATANEKHQRSIGRAAEGQCTRACVGIRLRDTAVAGAQVKDEEGDAANGGGKRQSDAAQIRGIHGRPQGTEQKADQHGHGSRCQYIAQGLAHGFVLVG